MTHYVVINDGQVVGVFGHLRDAENYVGKWSREGRPIVQLWDRDGYSAQWSWSENSVALLEDDIR